MILAIVPIFVILSLASPSPAKEAARESTAAPPPALRAHQGSWVKEERSDLVRVIGVRWKEKVADPPFLTINAEEYASPCVSPDHARVYYGTSAGVVEARAVPNGELLWSHKSLGAIGASMAEYHGKLIVGAGSNLLALDAENGQEKWRIDLAGGVGGQIVVTSSLALVPLRPNAMVAVDVEKGSISWRLKRATPEGITLRGEAPAAVDPARNRAYLGFSDGAVVAVTLTKGDTVWTTTLVKGAAAFADVDARPILVDGKKALIVASYSGGLAKLDAETGRVMWKREVERITGLVRAGDNGLLVASHGDGQALGIYPENGKIRWRYRFKKGAPIAPIYLGRDMVLVPSTRGAHAILDVTTGRPIQLLAFGSGSSNEPAWRDPDLAFLTNRGDIFVLRYGGGSGVKPSPVSR
jgi:outer membrane protein assembly factor BamB